jgi:D-alanyl-D-alanine dipeptidase
LLRSSGIDIPNITGRALYNGKDFNNRLGREEFIIPVLYGMASKIFTAQQAALADGNTLIIYEAFRPAEPHELLFKELTYLVENYEDIREGVSSGTFRVDLFLAPAPYNHQRGTAIDVSLGIIVQQETRTAGDYIYTYITQCVEYQMQTPVHELSIASAVFKRWVNARTFTGWLSGEFSDSATEATKTLQKYCTDAGLTPLATEWWHFNDLNWSPPLVDVGMTGEFFIEKTYSRKPE